MAEIMSLMSLMLGLLMISIIINMLVLQHVSGILKKIERLEEYVYGNSNEN